VIARYDAVSIVVQRAQSTGGIRRYDPSISRPQRVLRTVDRKWREAKMVARGFQSASHPILAQIVPIRRCNLACTYCNEYDKHSPPVALATIRERIDHLARLRTANIEISGGEPLLHPDLDELISHIRGTGALAGLITNGYLLNEKRIEDFNNAGLDHLQISIDNVKPDDMSKKSLKVLDAKLQMLAKHAAFSVNINSVLGGDLSNPEDALTIAKRAIELGLTATVGLIHNGHGRLIPLTPDQLRVYSEITSLTAPFYTVQKQNDFQRNLSFGRPNAGTAGPAAAISTSVRMASCIGAHSSAAIQGSRSPSTPPRTCCARARPRRAVRRSAPYRACTAWRSSTAFARSHSRRSTRSRRTAPAEPSACACSAGCS
jgi:organic radical activating enzyme